VSLGYELARVVEVGWLDPVGVGGREHNQLNVFLVTGDVGLESAADEYTEAVDRSIESGTRCRRFGVRRILGGEHVDALSPKLNGVADRGVVDHPGARKYVFNPNDLIPA
jgi:hypothetical protein